MTATPTNGRLVHDGHCRCQISAADNAKRPINNSMYHSPKKSG